MIKHQTGKFWQWRRGSQEMKHCIKRFFWGKEVFVARRKQGNWGLGSWRELTEPARHLHKWTEDTVCHLGWPFYCFSPLLLTNLKLEKLLHLQTKKTKPKIVHTHICIYICGFDHLYKFSILPHSWHTLLYAININIQETELNENLYFDE